MKRASRQIPEYRNWCAMIDRCERPGNDKFYRYGGRGIRVCERWRNSFEVFLADMGTRPTPQHTLDRIDNDGNYEPNNCEWATRKQQAQNTRRNRNMTLNGETHCMSEWSRRIGVSIQGILYRIRMGLPVEKVLAPRNANQRQGERKPCAKLTENDVRGIRGELARGAGRVSIAKRYGVTPAAIRSIDIGATWKHVA